MLPLSLDPSRVDPDLLDSPSLDEGGLLSPVTVLSFCFFKNDNVVPTDGAKVLMQFFGPVTWHHQRRPLRPRLGLQNKKGLPGVHRRSLLRRSSQPSVCMERREKEREEERARENRSSFNNFLYSLFIPLCAICPFCPCQGQGSTWTFSKVLRNIP
jgi:hypothetical protein